MQTIFQLIGLLGLFLALIGSIYLAKRVFKKEITLQQFLKRNYKDDLVTISDHLDETGDERKALHAIVSLLNVLLIDMEASDSDTYRRAKIGMAYLIFGAVFQAIAIAGTLLATPQ